MIPRDSIPARFSFGLSEKVKNDIAGHLDLLSSYPDREYTSLRQTISEYCHIPAEFILPGNGSSELISLLIDALSPKHTLILGPTYSEYSRELSFSGSTQEYYHLKEEQDFRLDADDLCTVLAKGNYDLLIICNPNNPTSSAILQDDMEKLLCFCADHGVFVMIDETYAEFAPENAGVSAVGLLKEYNNFVILRGVSKFFAAPGLRLGYAMTSNLDLLAEIRERKNPWTLNSLADVAGSLMFTDREYIEQTRELISSERERVFRELASWKNVKVYRPWANFILVRILKEGVTAYDIFLHAIRRGLMLRDCSTFPGLEDETFFRFCFMMPEKNTELMECLKELLG